VINRDICCRNLAPYFLQYSNDTNHFMILLMYISWQGWPTVHPDILVATPAALLNYLFDYDPEKRRREKFLRNVKFIVSS
jgi:hypothetical protein